MKPRNHYRWSQSLLAALALLLLPLAATAEHRKSEQKEVPEVVSAHIPPILFARLPHRDPSFPVFVSASTAIDEDGEIDTSLFSEEAVERLERLLAAFDPASRCIVVEEFYESVVNPPDRSSIEKAARTAALIIVGEVVGRDYGFQHFLPGQVLRMRLERVVKGSAKLDHYLVFLPVGTFTAGPHKFCKTDYRYPKAPELGERVVLFIPAVDSPREPFLDLRSESSIITVHRNDNVDLPSIFADDFEPLDLAALTAEEVIGIASAVALEEEKK